VACVRERGEPEEFDQVPLGLPLVPADRQSNGVNNPVHDLEVGRDCGGVKGRARAKSGGDRVDWRPVHVVADGSAAECRQLPTARHAWIDLRVDDANEVDCPTCFLSAPTEQPCMAKRSVEALVGV
jgi:hypothetical protein